MTNMWVLHSLTLVKFKLILLKTLQKLKKPQNLYSRNCVALENNIYARLPSTEITNMVYTAGSFYLDGGRENKYFKLFLLDNIFDGDGRFCATEV